MKFSDFAFLKLAFSTKSRIFETVDSPNSLVVFIFKTPVIFITPLVILSPHLTVFGTLSPVSATVSSDDLPSTITPSSGTFSPGLTTIMLPISTSSGSTLFKLSFSKIFA